MIVMITMYFLCVCVCVCVYACVSNLYFRKKLFFVDLQSMVQGK